MASALSLVARVGGATATRALLRGILAATAFALALGSALPASGGTPRKDLVSFTADKAVEAVGAKDVAALQTLAEQDDPDPWIVADLLVARGRPDVAKAFAAAAPREAVRGLVEYVSRTASTDTGEPPARARLAVMATALDGGDVEAAIAGAEAGEAPRAGLLGAQWLLVQARALVAGERFAPCACAARQAAVRAEAIGWRTGQAQALEQAARGLERSGDLAGARGAAESWLGVERDLGSLEGRGRATAMLALVAADSGDAPRADALAHDAFDLSRQAGDPEYEGHALATLSALAAERGDAERCADLAKRALARLDAPAPALQAARFHRDARRVGRARAALLEGLARNEAERGRDEEAGRYVSQAIAAAEEHASGATVASLLSLKGSLRERVGDRRGALVAYETALTKATRAGDAVAAENARRHVAALRRSLGEPASAGATDK